MFMSLPLHISVLLTALACATSAASAYYVVHDRTIRDQCWHEVDLRTTTIQTSAQDHTVEIVNSIPTIVEHTLFNLPWPWSYRPTCTGTLPSIPSGLCVYTSTTFASGRGISLVTTPRTAEYAASLPAFQSQAQSTNAHSTLWHAASIPGKGIGTLASQDLKSDSKILEYTPAFLAYLEDELPTLARETLWRTAISQLPAPTRDDFLALVTIYNDPRVKVQDIVKANTFQLLLGAVNHLAIFPETSRLNHDCAPNAQYVIDAEMLTHTVHTTRDVRKGEEITIAYTSPLEKADVRREHMREGFGFECTCARCTDIASSDAILGEINYIQHVLSDWSEASQASPQMAQYLIDLYEGQGMEGFLDVPFGHAALAANAVGDVQAARWWAEKARMAVLRKDGKDAGAMKVWESLLADTERHWSFGRRVR